MSLSPLSLFPPARQWTARCAALSAVALLALPAAAAPQFGVATLAAANDYEAIAYAQAGYNASFNGGVVWMPTLGDWHFSSCNPNLQTCVPVAGSSPGTANADALTSISSARLYVYPGAPYIDTQGTAYAAADLASGTLRAAATGQRRPVIRPVIEGTDGYAAARQWDTLNFHVAGANPGTRTTIQVSYEVEGVYDTGGSSAGMSFAFNFGQGASAFGGSDASGYLGGNHPGNWINPIMTWAGPGHMLFTAGYELVGEDTEVGLLMQLTTLGGFGSADFSHTAALSFDLPSSVRFTSASGVFLTATDPGTGGGDVPEPASLALACAAMLGLRWSRRRV